jgi:hypothetical protein
MSLEIDIWHDTSERDNPATRKQLLQFRWSALPGQRLKLPTLERRSFDAPNATMIRWSWQKLPAIELNKQTVDSLLGWIRELAMRLQAGDVEPFIAAAEPRFRDVATAYGYDPAVRAAEFRASIEEAARMPGWLLEPIVPQNIALRLVGGGRLIQCIDLNRLPLLRCAENAKGARPALFPMIVAPFQKKWMIYC